jgi:hypothetical protein
MQSQWRFETCLSFCHSSALWQGLNLEVHYWTLVSASLDERSVGSYNAKRPVSSKFQQSLGTNFVRTFWIHICSAWTSSTSTEAASPCLQYSFILYALQKEATHPSPVSLSSSGTLNSPSKHWWSVAYSESEPQNKTEVAASKGKGALVQHK